MPYIPVLEYLHLFWLGSKEVDHYFLPISCKPQTLRLSHLPLAINLISQLEYSATPSLICKDFLNTSNCRLVFYVKTKGESMNHLLIHCTIPKELMNLLLCQFGASWVMPNSIIAMLASWMGNLANSIVQRFGWWLLNVIYGACGERGIIILSKERSY